MPKVKIKNSTINVVMYHYIREIKNSSYPSIKGLEFKDFKKQIDFFCDNFNVISNNDFIENNIEYIDILCHGFNNNSLENAGFLKKTKKQKIPDHFEPYTGKDARLNFCILINKYKKNIILLKGDGDQDRPNLV